MTLTETVKGAASLTARFALYPSILYNLARNRLQDNWHWWDKITEVRHTKGFNYTHMIDQFREKIFIFCAMPSVKMRASDKLLS
jgi:hypothetical protein